MVNDADPRISTSSAIKKIGRVSPKACSTLRQSAASVQTRSNTRQLSLYDAQTHDQCQVCTNQQPQRMTKYRTQRGGVVPNSVWVGPKRLLAFPRVPVTPGSPLEQFYRRAAS